MKALALFVSVCAAVSLGTASPALALANRVFVSARSGNNANACDNINTPCQTFAGSVTQLNPGGEVIVLDSGGYGPVTITQGVTIEAPAGVTAFIHPPSGDAVTINAPGATVTLRGLVLNGGDKGITVSAIGILNVENCFITDFATDGILMAAVGRLDVKGSDIKGCGAAIQLLSFTGLVEASIDHCHLDGNNEGLLAATVAPGSSEATVTQTTANHNIYGWLCGNGTSGKDVLVLESCSGSENSFDGLLGSSSNGQSTVQYSNCVFAHNAHYGVAQSGSAVVQSRGNNTVTGNPLGATFGTVGSFPPM